MNERQKIQIAEALSKAETVEETRVIYETLQGAVGQISNKRPAESLREAVNKTSSTILLSRNIQENVKPDSVSDRWRLLAGIKK